MNIGIFLRKLFHINTFDDFLNSTLISTFKEKGRFSAIDLGCGEGKCIVESKYNANIKKIFLVDFYTKPFKNFEKDKRISFHLSDANTFLKSLKNECVQFILAKDFLEHTSSNVCLTILKECNRILEKEGKILIQVPNGTSPFGLRNYNNDLTHKQFIGHIALQDLTRKAGFKMVYIKPVVEVSSKKFGLISTIFQKKLVEPILHWLFDSSIGWSGKFFWTPNIIILATK